jgi:hypothetical protein
VDDIFFSCRGEALSRVSGGAGMKQGDADAGFEQEAAEVTEDMESGMDFVKNSKIFSYVC